MKTSIISKFLIIAALAAGATACHDNPDYLTDGADDGATGSVGLTGLDVEVDPAEIEVSRAGVDTDAFLVRISDAEGNNVYSSTVAGRNEIITLPVGQSYLLEVLSHEMELAAWNAPYYYGKKTFDIVADEITTIGVVECHFENIRVSVRYTPELQAMLGSDVKVNVSCSESGADLDFTPAETRSGYFAPAEGSTTLGASFTGTVNSQSVAMTKAFNNVQAGQHRIITFGVRAGNTDVPDEFGSISISGNGSGTQIAEGLWLDASVTVVDVNGNVVVEEDADSSAQRPGQEENGGSDPVTPPTPGSGGLTIESPTLDFDAQLNPDDYPAAAQKGKVLIHSDAGLTNLLVEIATSSAEFNETLSQIGMPTSFDLAATRDANEADIMTGFNFPVDSDVKGKNDIVFDISEFIPLLSIYGGTHSFTITVKDASGQLSKTLTFKVVK